jgi:hypothetical protein
MRRGPPNGKAFLHMKGFGLVAEDLERCGRMLVALGPGPGRRGGKP